MRYNISSGYGQLLAMQVAGAVGPNFGKILIVCPTADANYLRIADCFKPDADGLVHLYTTLEAAYAAATSNANDVILLAGYSTHTIANGIAWSKSRVNLIGMDGGDRLIQQGSKVQSTDTAADAYVIKVTGTRNSFRNIKFIQVDTDAAALTVAQMGGEGNLYKNCSFVFGVADNLSGTTTYEVVCGEDSGTFINCMFGNDTLLTSGARAVMLIDQVTASQEMKSCVFKDCIWQIQSSSSSADFIRIAATTDCKFTQTFINPVFNNSLVGSSVAVALDDAVRSISGLVEGNLLFVNPASNCTEFCTDVADQVKVIGPAMDGTSPDQKIGIALTPA